MLYNSDRKEELKKNEPETQPAADVKQKQTDPNITELKGFVDPKEDLEPKGTDNHID